MIPALSGILVFGSEAHTIDKSKNDKSYYTITRVVVPEIEQIRVISIRRNLMQIVAPYEDAAKFSEALQRALRNIKCGDFDGSLDFAVTPDCPETAKAKTPPPPPKPKPPETKYFGKPATNF